MEHKLTDAAKESQEFNSATDKRTGERVYYVQPTNDYINTTVNIFETSDVGTVPANLIEFDADIEWQKYRMEVAKGLHRMLVAERIALLNADVVREIAVTAVAATDALITALKKKPK